MAQSHRLPGYLSFVLNILAHSSDLVAVLVQHIRHWRHNCGDNSHDCQSQMRAQVLVHLDRGRTQRTGDDVAGEGHEAQSGGRVLKVHEDDVHVGRSENADKRVAENSRGHDGRPDADVSLEQNSVIAEY